MDLLTCLRDIERKGVRYAHAEGHTNLCFTDDGRYIVTCGSDSDLRTWTSIDDDDPSSHCVGEPSLSIAFRDNKLYIGNVNNVVQCYSFPEFERCGQPLKFSAPVTGIDISSDGKLLAASSCDMNIKIINLESKKIVNLSGHSAPILSVALDPKMEYLASSSCDGTVKVWNILNGQIIKTFTDILPKCNDFFTAMCLGSPSWQGQTGSHLAIPEGKKVNIYWRDKWNFKHDLKYFDIEKPISVASFSPCGSYVCAATTVGEIIIWNSSNHNVLSYTKNASKVRISALAWHPKEFEITYCDTLGQLGTLNKKTCDIEKNKGESNDNDEHGKLVISQNTIDEENSDAEMENGIESGKKIESGGVSDFNDDSISLGSVCDEENEISIDKIKAASGCFPSTQDDDERNYADERNSEDEGNCEVERNCEDERNSDCEDVETDHGSCKLPPIDYNMQNSFQPSSTPVHFQHRYMVWNSIGVVRSCNYEEEKAIEVEFHDSMFHHSLRMVNHDNFELGSLSHRVLALASNSVEDGPSKLLGVLLNAWDGTKEWSLQMTENESITALASSGNWVCCATDANYLRFYNSTGTQRQVISLPGPIVCMNGFDRLLFVACHMGLGVPQCQNIGYMLFQVSDLFIKCENPCQPLPLYPKSTLKWLGFTDEGTPAICDSKGILRLSRDHLHWVVACDTSLQCKVDSDHYFIIGISERLQNIRCILCKGSYFPMTIPRPTVVEIPLKIPLCEPNSEKAIQEDIFWRYISKMVIVEELSETNDEYKTEITHCEKMLKQSVLKLFANSCRDDANMRAAGIAALMADQPLQMAIKYASKVGRSYLRDKLSNLAPKDWTALCQEESVTNDRDGSGVTNVGYGNFPKFEIKNKMNWSKTSHGDMFEDSQQTSNEVNRYRVNEMEDGESSPRVVVNSPKLNVARSVNPFKIKNKEENSLKGLSFFNSVKQSNVKGSKLESTTNSEKVTKLKQANKEQVPCSQGKKQKFVEWFKSNNSMLQSKYPDLGSSELAKVGMKMFREINQGDTTEKEDDASGIDGRISPELKRRKIENIDGKGKDKPSALSQLNAFHFNK